MIYLDVEPYCKDCPNFEPDITKNSIRGAFTCDTRIRCEHQRKCECMYAHLLNHMNDCEGENNVKN